MQNTDKLYTLFAKIPGSVFHYRFHPYRYIDPKTGEQKEETLLDVDIAIFGFLHMNSNMKSYKNGGTGMTQEFSAREVSEASRANAESKPAWSTGTVKRSLRRLTRGGFILDKVKPTSKRRVKLFDPCCLPSRQRIALEQVERRRISFEKEAETQSERGME